MKALAGLTPRRRQGRSPGPARPTAPAWPGRGPPGPAALCACGCAARQAPPPSWAGPRRPLPLARLLVLARSLVGLLQVSMLPIIVGIMRTRGGAAGASSAADMATILLNTFYTMPHQSRCGLEHRRVKATHAPLYLNSAGGWQSVALVQVVCRRGGAPDGGGRRRRLVQPSGPGAYFSQRIFRLLLRMWCCSSAQFTAPDQSRGFQPRARDSAESNSNSSFWVTTACPHPPRLPQPCSHHVSGGQV